MRVWDISPEKLCRAHLLGEHREVHAIWSILTKKKRGYSKHPETLRWKGKLNALYSRHNDIVNEMERRGYNHKSKLDSKLAIGKSNQEYYINTPGKQIRILKAKKCQCSV